MDLDVRNFLSRGNFLLFTSYVINDLQMSNQLVLPLANIVIALSSLEIRLNKFDKFIIYQV